MRLKVVLPDQTALETETTRIVAEAPDGSFCLLPRHADFVAPLVPGLLTYGLASGADGFVALDVGLLVKCGPEVLVSTREAIQGSDLEGLKNAVLEKLQRLDEREQLARSALARLQAQVVRRLMELTGGGP